MAGVGAGVGLNLRLSYLDEVLRAPPPEVDFWEVIAENLISNPAALTRCERLRRDVPIALHCVGMNLGGVDALDRGYLERVEELCERLDPFIVSDHLCWQRHRGVSHHDLLPLPLTRVNAARVSERVEAVQNSLGRQIALENLSAYVAYQDSTETEEDVLIEIARVSGCGLLLDLNNIEVNARNLGTGLAGYMSRELLEHVVELHVAGPEVFDGLWLDTHASEPSTRQLDAVRRLEGVPVCYERDNRVPPLAESCAVVGRIKRARMGSCS